MKKGFTLIELLAVIVILAIIALIATPIIINIIGDTKESATLRSADFYLDAIELSIVQSKLNKKTISNGTYSIMNNGNICLEYKDDTCTDELIVEANGEVPNIGTITITNGEISDLSLTYNSDIIIRNEKGELVYKEPICNLVSDADNSGTITAGDEYLCKVKDEMEDEYENGYTFYVLTPPNDSNSSASLIMDRNICEDGSLEDNHNHCVYYWIESSMVANGPVTAINKLNSATENWKNELKLNKIYNDFGNNYSGFVLDGKARLPYYSELPEYNKDWLSKNITESGDGYWFMDSAESNSAYCFVAGTYRDEFFTTYSIETITSKFGIRPVIEVSIDNLK